MLKSLGKKIPAIGLQLGRPHKSARELNTGFIELMGFIEHHHCGRRQQLSV